MGCEARWAGSVLLGPRFLLGFGLQFQAWGFGVLVTRYSFELSLGPFWATLSW